MEMNDIATFNVYIICIYTYFYTHNGMLLKIVFIEILSNFVIYRYIEYAFRVPTQYNGLLVFPPPPPRNYSEQYTYILANNLCISRAEINLRLRWTALFQQ